MDQRDSSFYEEKTRIYQSDVGPAPSKASPPNEPSDSSMDDTDPRGNTAGSMGSAVDEEEMPVNDGTFPKRIGHYLILEPIAKGGMGLVFKAKHETLDRTAALKIMRPEFAKDRHFVERFLREAKLAASVEHPNVVPVYDAANEDGYLYIALRYVSGGHVGRLLRERGRLPEAEALDLLIGSVSGLEAIYEAGMIHRDIKPSNILLTDRRRPMIADLGLARAVEKSDNLTHAGQAIGTPSYMSPEQAKGAIDVDIRSDIYSFGVLLFALLTGKAPFKGSSIYETVAKVMYEPVPEPRQFAPDLSGTTRRLLYKAMDKDREKRFQSPEEMLEGLQEAKRELNKARAAVISAPTETGVDPAADAAQQPPQPRSRQKHMRMYRGVVIEGPEVPDLQNASSSEEGSSSSSLSSMVDWVKKKFATKEEAEKLADAAHDEGSSQGGSGVGKKKVRRFRGVDYTE